MAYVDIYRSDRLFLPQQKLLAFAREVPTPFFVYDEDGIRKTARLILGSFRMPAGHRAFFPVSVNNEPAILRIYREEGFGALTCSVRDLELARRIGFADILFHTAAMTAQTAEFVRSSGCGVIFDAPEQIRAFSGEPPERCLLRWQPERELCKGIASFRRGKSGMSRDQVIEAARTLRAFGTAEIGIHCHISGGIQDTDDYPYLVSVLLELAEELRQNGVRISIIDPGGGLPARPEPGRAQIHISAVGARIRRLYERLPEGNSPMLFTEFGRSAVARHGILVSRVAELRERSRSYAILDVSASQLAHNPGRGDLRLSVVGNCSRSGRKVYSVHGCTTSSRELICDRAILPPLSVGALVAVRDCGAYCQSVMMPHCMLPSCGGYLFTREDSLVPLSEHE